MIHRIEIIAKGEDTRALVLEKRLARDGYKIKEVCLVDVYTIDAAIKTSNAKKVGAAITNPVTQSFSLTTPLSPQKFTYAIEVGFLPGVTDNIANTAREMSEDLLRKKFKTGEGLYTSQVIFLQGKISQKEIEEIGARLYNPVIQRVLIKSAKEFKKDKGMGKVVPRVKLAETQKVDTVDLEVSDEELQTIGKKGIANTDGSRRGPLALDLLYLHTIRDYFRKKSTRGGSALGRKPTDIELESLAQTWSEHCKHTIFADPIDDLKDGLFQHYIKRATEEIRAKKIRDVIARNGVTKQSYKRSLRSSLARDDKSRDFCVSVFTDNSGAIEFDREYLITHKVETHNSPSALDPFGGAITGIVGVNRDTIGFGLGAKPIANTYGFCFADPKDESPLYKGVNFTQKMLSPRRIMEGVIAGVNSGGNCSGIPTPQGFLFFDPRYKGKPLVFVGTVGLIPKKVNGKKMYVKKAKPGDYVVMVGGRVGLDGIHGATFSSEAMDSGSPATAVQIGDPITQKKLSDAVVKEARDLGLFNSITDNGAGGLSCSVAEMAKECGGCFVNLEKVPLKYPGLAPWQTWISESQERMTLAVPKNKWKKFSALMKRRGVEATVIGTFTHSGKCIVHYKSKEIMNVDMQFLHDGLPEKKLITTFTSIKHEEPKISLVAKKGELTVILASEARPESASRTDSGQARMTISEILLKILSRPNITSFEFISMQYDHEVQSTSVIKPLQGRGRVNGETSVVKPVMNSNKGFILSHGLYPSYSDIDTYHMAASCIDTAIRNVVAAGGDPGQIALLDNFCWCSSTEPERLGQLKRAAKACYDYATAFGTPFISGKDSMFNDFKGYDAKGNPVKISVPPTLLVSAISVIDDVKNVISIDAKFPGDLIYILGETHEELGGSEYFSSLGFVGNQVPQVDAKQNLKLYKSFYNAVGKGLISSATSVTRGGLAVALTKMALSGMWGIDVSLKKLPGKTTRYDVALFSESQGRIVVTINLKYKRQFEKVMEGNAIKLVGEVVSKPQIVIQGISDKKIVAVSLDLATKAYKGTFKNF